MGPHVRQRRTAAVRASCSTLIPFSSHRFSSSSLPLLHSQLKHQLLWLFSWVSSMQNSWICRDPLRSLISDTSCSFLGTLPPRHSNSSFFFFPFWIFSIPLIQFLALSSSLISMDSSISATEADKSHGGFCVFPHEPQISHLGNCGSRRFRANISFRFVLQPFHKLIFFHRPCPKI